MSKKSLGRSILEILRGLGVEIPKETEVAIEKQKDLEPGTATEDIVIQMALAPPEVMSQAMEIARAEGSTDLLADRYSQAIAEMEAVKQASHELASAAEEIVKKSEGSGAAAPAGGKES